MRGWFILVGLLLLGFPASAVQLGETPSQAATPVTTSTAGAQPAKTGWQLSNDERFALRTNAGLARQRVAETRQRPATDVHAAAASTQPSANAQWADSFDGKTHPELFLPHEVFRNFVGMAFEGDSRTRDIVRQGMATDIRKAGLPPDFWERVEPMIAFHVADVRSEKDLLASRSKMSGAARDRVVKRLELKRTDVCRSRAEALAAARNAFGRERFDRFLYDAVAIHMFHVSDRLPTVDLLRRWEGGCR